jgi:SAM-dependent methyltransferase
MKQNTPCILKRTIQLSINLIEPMIGLKRFIFGFQRYIQFFVDMFQYRRLAGKKSISILDLTPKIHDKKISAGVEDEGFYQNAWAFRVIYSTKPPFHVDVGSDTAFLGILSAVTKVIYIDIRPYGGKIENLEFRKGDILRLPFEDRSVRSLSSLHTIEHIGLGRYGDKLDPDGSRKAILELKRVLAIGGNLFISVPVGRSRIRFNCHRVFSPDYIPQQCSDLHLVEMAGIGPEGLFQRNITPEMLKGIEYTIGLYWFKS